MTREPRRALVTGGSAGLGAAAVNWLQANRYEVVVLDRDRPWTGKTPVDFIRCDLASRTELDDVLPELITAGPYDLVVLNAGINATGKFEALDPRVHIDVLRVNAEGPMVIAAGLLEAGACRTGGAMVFVSSLSHFTGYPGAASYAASKDALAIYAKSMRKYAASKGVTLTVAFPGPLKTDHAERHSPKAPMRAGGWIRIGRQASYSPMRWRGRRLRSRHWQSCLCRDRQDFPETGYRADAAVDL